MTIIQGIIDRFEENQAVIRTDDGFSIIWPKEKLDAEAKEGDAVKLAVLTDQDTTEDNEALAKQILNQILKGSK